MVKSNLTCSLRLERRHVPLHGCGPRAPEFQLESQSQQGAEVKEKGLLSHIHGPGLGQGISVMTGNKIAWSLKLILIGLPMICKNRNPEKKIVSAYS